MNTKKYFLALSMAAAAIFTLSCNREPNEPNPAKEGTVVFTAQSPSVKTTIEDGTGTTRIVKWEVNDEIDIFWDGGTTTSEATTAGTTTTFEATVDPASAYYAVYPVGNGDMPGTDVLAINVPASQDGTFASANIAVAKTDAISHNFAFSNATALVKFNITDASYTKLVFAAASGEAIAGDANVDFNFTPIQLEEAINASSTIEVAIPGAGEYYFAALPVGALAGGFSVTLYKGTSADKTVYVTTASLERASILNLGAVDGVSTVTDVFVKPIGAGTKSGKSWDNAMGVDELREFIAQPVDGSGAQISDLAEAKARILDGVTIHMAKGDYYLAGEAGKHVKVEFNGYDHQVAITFRGGYPDDKTGTDVSGWTMPSAAEAAPTYCTAFTGNDEAGIFVFGNQTNVTFEGITFKDGNLSSLTNNSAAVRVEAGSTGNSTLTLTYCRVIDNNNSDSYSGAGIAVSKGSATFDHCYFGGNHARNGSAINLGSGGGTVTISDCLFKGNTTFNTSGALQNGGKTLTVTTCTFEGNTAGSYGGGAFHTNGTGANTTFTDCVFTGNSAGQGGAVSVQTAQVTFTDCTFTNNTATNGSQKAAGDDDSDVLGSQAGGAIILHNANSVCTLNNCTFTGNSATKGNGGAIAYENAAATLNINAGTTFSNCTAYNLGGAIFTIKGKLNITGTSASKVSFTGCHTLATGNQHGNGGAIWLGDGSTTSVTYAVFDGCEAGQEDGSTVNYSNGGAIRMRAVSSFSASNCEFTGCRGRNGMCLSFELGSKKATFTDCDFHDNIGRSGASNNGTAGNFHGGAAQLGSGTAEFTRCAFTDNVAYHGSGAVHQNGASTTSKFTDCTFTRNSCLDGNAGCITVEKAGLVQADGCTFTNNSIVSGSTVRHGGVFYLAIAGSNLKATGCTFTGNKITGSGNAYGGVVRAQDNSDIEFTDCLFDGNGNVGSGGTIYGGGCIALNQNAHMKVNNCLFKNNVAKTRGAAIQGGTNVIVYMNNVGFYNNTTTSSGGWGVNTHFGNANVCMNNVSSYNNRSTNGSPGNCVSFNGDGGWLVVNSTIIDGTPTALVRRGGNSRKSIFCNNVLINTNTTDNVWAMNNATNFSSAGHNVISADDTYNNAAPAGSDLLGKTSLPSGSWSEHWDATPHYAVYTWTGSLTGFTPAVQADVTAAIEAYDEVDTIHTSIASIGADFKAWLESLSSGYAADGRCVARGTGDWWPGAYQN